MLIPYVSYRFGYRAIFVVAASMAVPAAIFSLIRIDPKEIDHADARGLSGSEKEVKGEGLPALLKDRVLLYFDCSPNLAEDAGNSHRRSRKFGAEFFRRFRDGLKIGVWCRIPAKLKCVPYCTVTLFARV